MLPPKNHEPPVLLFALTLLGVPVDWRWVFPLLAVVVVYVLWQIVTMDEYFPPRRLSGEKGGKAGWVKKKNRR